MKYKSAEKLKAEFKGLSSFTLERYPCINSIFGGFVFFYFAVVAEIFEKKCPK